jgi:hypothetical protein
MHRQHIYCRKMDAVKRIGILSTHFPVHGVQHGGEFLGEHEQTPIACLLAHNADEAACSKTGADDTIVRPGGIHFGEEAGDLVPTGSFARLAGFANKDEEEVQGVTGGADHAVRAGANDVAKGGEQLEENGFRLGLGVRGQGAHGFSGEAVERVLLEYGLVGVLGLGRRFVGSRDGLVLGVKAGLGDRIVASLFYVCEGGRPVSGYRRS